MEQEFQLGAPCVSMNESMAVEDEIGEELEMKTRLQIHQARLQLIRQDCDSPKSDQLN